MGSKGMGESFTKFKIHNSNQTRFYETFHCVILLLCLKSLYMLT